MEIEAVIIVRQDPETNQAFWPLHSHPITLVFAFQLGSSIDVMSSPAPAAHQGPSLPDTAAGLPVVLNREFTTKSLS
jgi:hypothetical protein